MWEWNLNILITFFWLSLSAGLILPGIWSLLDYKIDHLLINLILQRFSSNDKLIIHGFIPKSYYLHFYLIGLIINIIFFLFHLSFFLLFILLILHLFRRLYECLYIHKYQSKINCFSYLFGLIYYPCIGLTIIIDYKYSYTNIHFFKYIFACVLFFNASYIQYHIHLTLANIKRNKEKLYPIPNGYWLFNYFSSPNYIAEIFIYLSFFLASHRTSAMTSLIIWVFINQSLSALLNHRWYCRYYKEFYPSKRCALIPFIL